MLIFIFILTSTNSRRRGISKKKVNDVFYKFKHVSFLGNLPPINNISPKAIR